jgi:hypothetical protein
MRYDSLYKHIPIYWNMMIEAFCPWVSQNCERVQSYNEALIYRLLLKT